MSTLFILIIMAGIFFIWINHLAKISARSKEIEQADAALDIESLVRQPVRDEDFIVSIEKLKNHDYKQNT